MEYPVNTIGVLVYASNGDTDGKVEVAIANADNVYAMIANEANMGSSEILQTIGWIPFERGDSRDFQWQGDDDDNNNFQININGYQIER